MGRKYYCPKHKLRFNHKEELISHLFEQHNNLQCFQCNREFTNKVALRLHLKFHLRNDEWKYNKMYECQDHGMLFSNHEQYIQHKDKECEQMLLQRKICAFHLADEVRCKKSFFTTTGLVLHYERHHHQFLCVECYELFNNENLLEHHGNIPHYPQHSTCEYLHSFTLSSIKWIVQINLLGVHSLYEKTPLFKNISIASEECINLNFTQNSSNSKRELSPSTVFSSLSDHILHSNYQISILKKTKISNSWIQSRFSFSQWSKDMMLTIPNG